MKGLQGGSIVDKSYKVFARIIPLRLPGQQNSGGVEKRGGGELCTRVLCSTAQYQELPNAASP